MTIDTDPIKAKDDPRISRGDAPEDIYQIIKYEIRLGTTIPLERMYEVSGDHLYCAEMSMGNAIWVKIGARKNPWIRMQEGDTIRRRFSRIWIRGKMQGDEYLNVQSAVFYASYGRFVIDRMPNSYGLKPGFLTFGATTNVIGAQSLRTFLDTILATPTSGLQSLGKRGATIHLFNNAAVGGDFLVFTYDTSALPPIGNCYPIPPQTEKILNLDSALNIGDLTQSGAGGGNEQGLYIGGRTAAGVSAAVPFFILLSPLDFDYTLPDTDNIVAAIPPLNLGE